MNGLLDSDDEFLTGVLALLEDTPANAASPSTSFACDAALAVVSPRVTGKSYHDDVPIGSAASARQPSRSGNKLKRTIEELREQATQLELVAHSLRDGSGIHSQSRHVETALAQRTKRRKAEDERDQLRDAVLRNAVCLRGLRSMFFTIPDVVSSVDLCKCLHSYTRLPPDRPTRWNEYATLAQEKRLALATGILESETASVMASVSKATIQVRIVPSSNGFGVVTTSVYAMETEDVGAVFRGALVAVHDIVTNCTAYQCTDTKRKIVDPDVANEAASADTRILYRVVGTRQRHQGDAHELSMEARMVTTYKQTNESAVLLWDYVDDDVLHPYQETTDLTREAIGACVIRRERCDDGLERAVYRAVCARQFRPNAHTEPSVMEKFCVNLGTESAFHADEMHFRRLIADQIDQEKAAYQAAITRLAVVA